MKKSILRSYLFLLPCLLLLTAGELIFLEIRGTVGSLSMSTVQSEAFRAMDLSEGTYEKVLKEAERTGEEPEEILAVSMVLHRFSLTPFRVESSARYRRAKNCFSITGRTHIISCWRRTAASGRALKISLSQGA